MNYDIQSILNGRSQALESFIQGQKKQVSASKDPLIENAQKRATDRVKFTYYFLKKNLIDELNATVKQAEKETPELKGEYYMGILSGKSLSVEVIPLKEAAASVSDVDQEKALEMMEKNKMGFFSPENFTMTTPKDPKYQQFKSKIQSFLNRSQGVIHYLQNHPEANITLEELKPNP